MFLSKKYFFLFLLLCQCAYAKKPMTLSLNEAIYLAVRNNPNIVQVQLAYVAQKFNLYVEQWQFYPHYSLQIAATAKQGGSTINPQPGVTLLTPVGTQLSLTANNASQNRLSPGLSFQIMQPLMRGFGKAIVENALNNAKDADDIARLSIEGALRGMVTAVINAYLDIVSAEKTIVIDQDAVKRAEQSVIQTKLYIKGGHKAGNELVTVLANVASAKMQLENDKNNLLQARYALLMAIGLDPNTPIIFSSLDLEKLIQRYHHPSLSNTKTLILMNDIQYQIDQITLHGSMTRSLFVAEDNTRWQLNLSANAATGNNVSHQQGNLNHFLNGISQSQSVSLVLQIPIDDQLLKQSVVNAKVALKQAELALEQERWNKETSAINGWNTVGSTKRALRFAEDAENLQQKTYTISYQKYLHGLIDSIELQYAQLQLIQAEQALLNARITYLKALVNLDLLIGRTLKTWDVKVRL